MNSAQANDATQGQDASWREVVIEQLVIHHIYRKEHDADPRKAIRDLFCISNEIALDPRVSAPAQALIDRGRKEAQQEQPAQEPVCKVGSGWNSGGGFDVYDFKSQPPYGTKLYAAPTQSALTQEQAEKLAHRRATTYTHKSDTYAFNPMHLMDFVRAVEAHCRGDAT